MAYDVLEVCRHIINYSNEKGYEISNLKLQKLLYVVQGFFLVDKGEKCFEEMIEAWDFGPVVPKAYREYKIYGATSIPPVTLIYNIDHNNIFDSYYVEFLDNIITYEDKSIIDKIIDSLKDISPVGLMKWTHDQDPWKNTYKKGENNVIPIETIKEWFKQYGD